MGSQHVHGGRVAAQGDESHKRHAAERSQRMLRGHGTAGGAEIMTLADLRLGIRNLLLANAGIVGVVGDRVYPVVLPQGVTQDSLVYTRISEGENSTFLGPSGLLSTRIQLDAYSLSADRATTLADLVKEYVSGYRGTVSYGSNSPPSFVVIQGVFLLSGGEDYFSDSKLYRRHRDYNFAYGDRSA